jgi:hypothetical protein
LIRIFLASVPGKVVDQTLTGPFQDLPAFARLGIIPKEPLRNRPALLKGLLGFRVLSQFLENARLGSVSSDQLVGKTRKIGEPGFQSGVDLDGTIRVLERFLQVRGLDEWVYQTLQGARMKQLESGVVWEFPNQFF